MNKKNKIFQKLVSKQKEISLIPPNQAGIFTPFYRQIIIYFKIAPYRWLVPLAILTAIAFSLIFRIRMVNLTTILQRGF